ncbi:uncharacterized protein BDW70DRAFT_158393 [Aspergillus foveolatus]|uniref:uncharacterized protein n=1 Tax=Aspergillus foveolatus TaxID=210207 RepID=UPI003CCE537B
MSSTALEGWTFNDNSRSSWDIVWTCLTTIFACTWTVLHMSEIVLIASDEFWRVWSLRARCNEAQAASDCRTGVPDSWLYRRTKPLAEVTLAAGIEDREPKLHPFPVRWTLAQCWCVQMDGLTLETEDGGYSTNFTEREIKDRAKADTLAKTFTVCQSTWVTANIVARAGYGLSITPFEFATLSYVACAIMAYACWWKKPQDMAVPITIPLRHRRDAMSAEIRRVMDARPDRWMHRHVVPPNEPVSAGFALIGSNYHQRVVGGPASGALRRRLAAFLFCGIHVAAWNFSFPTDAEAIAWRVFSLVALAMPVIVYLLGQAPLVARWLKGRGVPLPSFLDDYADSRGKFYMFEIYVPRACILVYALARLGLVALTFSSLRALPSGVGLEASLEIGVEAIVAY